MSSLRLMLGWIALSAGIAGWLLARWEAALRLRQGRLARHRSVLLTRHRRQRRLRRLAQERLREERRRYWQQLRELNAPTMVTSPEGSILCANRALLDMLGYQSEEQLRALNVTALYANSMDRELRTRAMLESCGRVLNAEFKMGRRNGALIDVLLTVRVVRTLNGERAYESAWTDVTELRRAAELSRELEAQLHMAQKLEAVGQLAAGIAHEINTPIQFVGDNMHFLRTSWRKLAKAIERQQAQNAGVLLDAELTRLLDEAQIAFDEGFDGIQRVTEIVRAMKEFAHPGDGTVSEFDINQALSTTLVVARNEYKSIAAVATTYGDIPRVRGCRGEINEVLLNVIVNAAHAVDARVAAQGGRGQISIRTEYLAPFVLVEVEDNGIGMNAALIKRIFDPFFTTKAVGKGTGQGLAIARTIVNRHGGRIEVRSAHGLGATFSIYLPAAQTLSADAANSEHAESTPLAMGGRG